MVSVLAETRLGLYFQLLGLSLFVVAIADYIEVIDIMSFHIFAIFIAPIGWIRYLLDNRHSQRHSE